MLLGSPMSMQDKGTYWTHSLGLSSILLRIILTERTTVPGSAITRALIGSGGKRPLERFDLGVLDYLD